MDDGLAVEETCDERGLVEDEGRAVDGGSTGLRRSGRRRYALGLSRFRGFPASAAHSRPSTSGALSGVGG